MSDIDISKTNALRRALWDVIEEAQGDGADAASVMTAMNCVTAELITQLPPEHHAASLDISDSATRSLVVLYTTGKDDGVV